VIADAGLMAAAKVPWPAPLAIDLVYEPQVVVRGEIEEEYETVFFAFSSRLTR
jgi:hypothetical protein